jgi:hypothetical protein
MQDKSLTSTEVDEFIKMIITMRSPLGIDNDKRIDLLDRILHAYDQYRCFPEYNQTENIIVLSAEYLYKFMGVSNQVVNSLYSDNDMQSDKGDLLKQVHKRIIKLFYNNSD